MNDSIRIAAETWRSPAAPRGQKWQSASWEAGVKVYGHPTKAEALAALREAVLLKLRGPDQPLVLLWCGDGQTILVVRRGWYFIERKIGPSGSCGRGSDATLQETVDAAVLHAEHSYGGVVAPERYATRRPTPGLSCTNCRQPIEQGFAAPVWSHTDGGVECDPDEPFGAFADPGPQRCNACGLSLEWDAQTGSWIDVANYEEVCPSAAGDSGSSEHRPQSATPGADGQSLPEAEAC